jgi:5-methyltetrahydropteroyltriglutamate--homocysteine methyltransferase
MRWENGLPYDQELFEKYLRSGVESVVRKQAEIGIDVPSDGEFGKKGWIYYILERFTGLEAKEGSPNPYMQKFALRNRSFREFFKAYEKIERTAWLPKSPSGKALDEGMAARASVVCTGPIRYNGQDAIARDIENFKTALRSVIVEEAFLPVAAPCSASAPGVNQYYKSDEEFLYAVADALSEEYKAIADMTGLNKSSGSERESLCKRSWTCRSRGTSRSRS